MKARLAVVTAAAAVLATLLLPTPVQAAPDCDKVPTPPACLPEGPPPLPQHGPQGALTQVQRVRGLVTVRGTVEDPDAPGRLVYVAISVDGQYVVHGGGSPDFEVTLVMSIVPGPHRVCAEAQNIGEGKNVSLGCQNYFTPAPVDAPR